MKFTAFAVVLGVHILGATTLSDGWRLAWFFYCTAGYAMLFRYLAEGE